MAWTPWKKVADRGTWYLDHSLRVPVCYELGIGEPGPSSDAEVEVVYAATTPSELSMLQSCQDMSMPVAERLRAELDKGLEVFYRCNGAPTPERAQELLAEVMAARPHPWNG